MSRKTVGDNSVAEKENMYRIEIGEDGSKLKKHLEDHDDNFIMSEVKLEDESVCSIKNRNIKNEGVIWNQDRKSSIGPVTGR